MWERTGDHFAGCLILVEPVDGQWQGRITYLPTGMSNYGWKVGDIKWRDIRKLRWQTYSLMDLHKQINPETFELQKSNYQEVRLRMVSGSELVVSPAAGAVGSRSTRWQRAV